MSRVHLDVGGTHFTTTRQTLLSVPNTKLSRLIAERPSTDTSELFFDRNSDIFITILDFYRTGFLHVPLHVCPAAFKEELNFWEIDEKNVESCCVERFDEFNNIEKILDKFSAFSKTYPEPTNCSHTRVAVWRFLEDPMSSYWAKIPMSINLLATLVCVVVQILESSDSLRLSNPTNANGSSVMFSNFTSFAGPKLRNKLTTTVHPGIPLAYFIGMICIAADDVIRFLLSPFKRIFLKSVFNIIDIVLFSVLITVWLIPLTSDPSVIRSENYTIAILIVDAIIRILLISRLIKFGLHVSGFQVLFLTIKSSLPVIFVLLSLMGMATVLFASVIYVAEIKTEDYFPSAAHGLWWAFITMTTVGYGDMYPVTPGGYVVGTLCVVSGLLFTALPIAVLGNNFDTYWRHSSVYAAKSNEVRKYRKTQTA